MDRILPFLADHALPLTIAGVFVLVVMVAAVFTLRFLASTTTASYGGGAEFRRRRSGTTTSQVGGVRSSSQVSPPLEAGESDPAPRPPPPGEPQAAPEPWQPAGPEQRLPPPPRRSNLAPYIETDDGEVRPERWDEDIGPAALPGEPSVPAPIPSREPWRRWVARNSYIGREHEPAREDEQDRQQQQRPQAQVQEPAPSLAPAAAAPAPEAPRYINLAFKRAGTHQVVPSKQSLAPESTDYELRVNIGALSPDRIPEVTPRPTPTEFPPSALPPADEGHWLDVVTASRDFFVPLRAKAWLFLPRKGSSWVCDCDRRLPHRCAPEKREQFLTVPLLTPKAGDAVLRVGVYFKNNLLQSCQVTAKISSPVTQAKPQSVIVDYTIDTTLTDLQRLGAKTINILSAEAKGGGQAFVVNGDFENIVQFRPAEGQLRAAANAARQKLRDIHMSERNNIFGRKLINKFDGNNAKPKDGFIDDLRQVAPLGSLLWTTFRSQSDRWKSLPDDVLRAPSTIQIARASSNFVFPWSLVYDIPLESEPKKHIVCKIVDEWQDGIGLPLDGKYACPHENEHKVNTLCPFGFWGLRHIIEQPPSVGQTGTLASEIRVTSPPARLFLCASDDLDKQYTAPHLADLNGRLNAKFTIEPCVTREALLSRLQTVDPGVVYLYCHGGNEPLAGTDQKTPFLSVGDGEKLTPGDVLARLDNAGARLYWSLAHPLIFINGCHTAELNTDVMVNFVDTFARIYSSGVIGTEVTVHQLLANEAGAEFLQHFETETVGEALRRMRNHLLCKGNLMGLAYSAYCLSALRIADTARSTAAKPTQTGSIGG